jgi:nucleotide-binding universal stress UspA family protein
MRTLIATTDFSPSSINAVNYAADMAKTIKARLILFNAVPIPMAVSEIPVPEATLGDMLTEASRELKTLKDKLLLRTNGELDISTEVLMGNFADKIDDISDKCKPFAIVMGIAQGKAVERFLMGSNTFYAINRSPHPILIVPEKACFRPINKIGLACDLGAVVPTIPFKLIDEWVSVFNASLNVIHVSANGKPQGSLEVTEAISLQNHLNKFHPRFEFLTGNNLAEKLGEYSKEHNLDLLIVIPKHHGILGLFDKRYSKNIILHHKVPILSIHSGLIAGRA